VAQNLEKTLIMTAADPDNEATFREFRIPSTLRCCKEPETAILEELRRHQFAEDAIFAIKLALEEAMTNAVKHGNSNDQSKNVTVRYGINAEKAVVVVRDEGCGFCPEEIPDPTAPDRLPLPNGRGIMLMRAYMDDVHYRAGGCEVYFMKRNTR
jgi:serine/threonine-protein kinase RsbW